MNSSPMQPAVLYVAALLFLSAVVVHILLWRLRPPKHEILGVFCQLIFCPLAVFTIAVVVRSTWPRWLSLSTEEIVSVYILYCGLAGAYVATWPAAQTLSPTLALLLHYRRSMSQGLTGDYFKARMKFTPMIHPLIRDLQDAKLLQSNGDKLRLTSAGYWLAAFYAVYRRFLNLPDRGI